MPELATWRLIFRKGVAPQLSVYELLALQAGLQKNDPAIIQGQTTRPDAIGLNRREEPRQCCPVAYAIWKSADNIPGITVGEVDEEFAKVCAKCDQALGYERSIRHFLNWVDDTPRTEMIRDLLAELVLATTARSMELPAA